MSSKQMAGVNGGAASGAKRRRAVSQRACASLDAPGRDEALRLAAARGEHGLLCALLSEGTDLNSAGADGWTAVMHAAQGGHARCLVTLVCAGAALSHGSSYPLCIAAYHGHEACVVELLRGEPPGPRKDTALLYAAIAGNTPCVLTLLRAGANINATDRNMEAFTSLMFAVRSNHEQCVAALIKAGADINFTGSYFTTTLTLDSTTALTLASERGFAGCVNRLLRAGAHVGSAISVAARRGRRNCLRPLLRAGGGVGAGSTVDGCSIADALMSAIFAWRYGEGHPLCVQDLLRGGEVDLNIAHPGYPCTVTRFLPLAWAAVHGRLECMRVLIRFGARLEVDAVAAAASDSQLECLTELIRGGAPLQYDTENSLHMYKIQPVVQAGRRGSVECVQALVRAGALTSVRAEVYPRWRTVLKELNGPMRRVAIRARMWRWLTLQRVAWYWFRLASQPPRGRLFIRDVAEFATCFE